MKNKNTLSVYNSEAEIINNGIWNIITPKEKPFHISFSYEDEFVTVQLVNGKDVLKLANLFAEMLAENNIDYEIIKP